MERHPVGVSSGRERCHVRRSSSVWGRETIDLRGRAMAMDQSKDEWLSELAARHGMSRGAVETVLNALIATGGRSAQFNHPELGGFGQWMGSGMVMIGDMNNHALKARVDALCTEISAALRQR